MHIPAWLDDDLRRAVSSACTAGDGNTGSVLHHQSPRFVTSFLHGGVVRALACAQDVRLHTTVARHTVLLRTALLHRYVVSDPQERAGL